MDVLVDVNVAFALLNERHAFHRRACAWWDGQAPGFRIGVCRLVQMGLLRLLCNRAAMDGVPLSLPEAWRVDAGLVADSAVVSVPEPEAFQVDWVHLCLPFGASPKVVSDAYLATIAIRLAVPLATFERGFRHFPSLDVVEIP